MRVAAIDIGSNSVRLLVAEIGGDGGWDAPLETVARAGEPCRLGRGLEQSGRIDPDLTERAAVIAQEFARRARSLGAVHVLAGATAALRSAANGEEVAATIGARAGVDVRILSGDDEARLVQRPGRAPTPLTTSVLPPPRSKTTHWLSRARAPSPRMTAR